MNFKQLKCRAWLVLMVIVSTFVFSSAHAAVTQTIRSMTGPYPLGGQSKQVVAVMDLYGTYDTGGFEITPASVGLNNFQSVQVAVEDGYGSFYRSTSGTVQIYEGVNNELDADESITNYGGLRTNFVFTGW